MENLELIPCSQQFLVFGKILHVVKYLLDKKVNTVRQYVLQHNQADVKHRKHSSHKLELPFISGAII